MKLIINFIVALVIVLMDQVSGYSNNNEYLRRSLTKPHLEINEMTKDAFKSSSNHHKPVELFISMDKNFNQMLDHKEIENASKGEIFDINILKQKDVNKDRMISLNEFLMDNKALEEDKATSSAVKAVIIFFDNYGLIAGFGALILLFAGIRYSLRY